MRLVELEIGGVKAIAELFEKEAPRTVAAIWDLLPIQDRTIHVRWSGAAWRTDQNYRLKIDPPENLVSWLEAGDLIYYDDPRYGLYKVGVAYGVAQWRDDKGELKVTRIGQIRDNLQPFVAVCERILYEGPKVVVIRRRGTQ